MKKTRTNPTAAIAFLLILAAVQSAYPQLPPNPQLRNFSPKDYASNSFVLCSATDKAGRAYFGTFSEIVIYDGASWHHVPVGDGNYIFSMDLDTVTGIVYCGGSGDFGYLAVAGQNPKSPNPKSSIPNPNSQILNPNSPIPNSPGSLYYVSLKNSIPGGDENRHFAIVWQTHCTHFGVVFNAYTHLFVYHPQDGSMEVIKPDSLPIHPLVPQKGGTMAAGEPEKSKRFLHSFYAPALSASAGVQSILYIQHPGLGILTFNGSNWKVLPGTEEIVKENGIHSLHPITASGQALLLLYVKPDGFYLYDAAQQRTVHIIAEEGKYIHYNPAAIPYNSVTLSFAGAAHIFAGTSNDGIYSMELSTVAQNITLTPQFHLTKKEGLCDNMIWHQLATPLTSYRSPNTDHRLPLTDYRLPNTEYRLPLTCRRQRPLALYQQRHQPAHHPLARLHLWF